MVQNVSCLLNAMLLQHCWNDLCCTSSAVEECRAIYGLRFWLYTSFYLVLRQVAAILQANKSLENDARTRALDLKFSSLFPFSFPANLLLRTTARITSRLVTHTLSGNSLLSLAKNRISYFVSATRINCAKNLAWLIIGRPFLSEKARVHIHVCISRHISFFFYRVSFLVYAYVYVIYVCIHNA